MTPFTERLPSGRYRAGYRLPTGEKRHVPGTFDHKRAAAAAGRDAEVEAARTRRDPRAGEITWGSWHAQWWESRLIEGSTASSEASIVAAHIMPAFGSKPLRDITRHDVQVWATRLVRANQGSESRPRYMAPASASRALTVLRSSLSAAVDAGLIPANPATRIKLPPPPKGRLVWFTQDQYAALVDAIDDPRDKALADMLVGTGMRWGEATGLHIDRLLIASELVQVRDVWTGVDIRPYTKTKDHRDIPLLPWVTRHLNAAASADGCGLPHRDGSMCRSALVFTSSSGGVLDDRNWSRRVLQPALKRAGLDGQGFTIYTFRHTYASWLVQGGVPLLRVAELLGHSSTRTTEIYAHLAPASADDVRLALPAPIASDATAARPNLRAL